MEVINIILIEDNNLSDCFSYLIKDIKNSTETVKIAEEKFIELIKKDIDYLISQEELDSFIEDGYYHGSNKEIYFRYSSVN